jgi:L-2,4-diaminobutyrate decarboxylase
LLSVRVYSILHSHGIALFDAFVTKCYDLGQLLATLVDQHPDFELATWPACNIVCFRYKVGAADLSGHNEKIRERLKTEGRFYIVQTNLNGELWLRTTLTNPFTTEEDFVALLEEIKKIGEEMTATQRAQ